MKKSEGSRGLIQFVKFAVVGVSNTAVDWIVYYILINTLLTETLEKSIAKAISFVVAVINSYIWNTIWTFKKEYQKSVGKNGEIGTKSAIFFKFFIVSLIGWGVNYVVFRATIGKFSSRDIVALIFASGAATLWNFFANKLWTYRK
ncbi:MAG: GtrA family protein [Patescibacteria group bacterium]|jgi:putative flippase GtrA